MHPSVYEKPVCCRRCLLLQNPDHLVIMLSRSTSTNCTCRLSGRSSSSSSKPPLSSSLFQSRFITAPGTDYDQQYLLPTDFTTRPGYNTTGREVNVKLNSYPVDKLPLKPVHQYDVQIGNGAERRAVILKVWSSRARKDRTGEQFIFDGNKLGWSSLNIERDINIDVDLDAEEGRPPGRTSNTFRVVIRKAKTLDLSTIQAYFKRQIQMGPEILECISKSSRFHVQSRSSNKRITGFLDHLLREGPSRNPRFIPVRRQFFIRDGQRAALGGGIEVFRGVYQSLRLAEGGRAIINLDVANCCFWQPTSLIAAIIAKMRLRDTQGIIQQCRPVQDNGTVKASQFQKLMSKNFRKVLVKARYKGCRVQDKVWNIKDLSVRNARQHMIDMKDANRQPTGQQQSIFHFQRTYNVTLQFPDLPLVEMTKKDVLYPMEFLHLIENQRYPFKLDETQTANMIKFAVTRPDVRNASISEGQGWLNWGDDKFLKDYGLKVNQTMLRTKARLLPSPEVQFGGSAAKPGTTGRWDLRGKKFLTVNPKELVAWGIGVFGKADKPLLEKFAKDFAQAYRGHGGKVSSQPPNLMKLPDDPAQAVEALHNGTGNMFKQRPQLLIFVVQDKNSFHYLRIKKSCDCRFGVVSQVLQFQQVRKGNPQYYSNVLMKVNAKLGGTTAQSKPDRTSGFKAFATPTMLIGADVSHASPGSQQASMAALTVSFDRFGGRYAAACQTNGQRVEIITEANWSSMLRPLADQWVATVGGGRVPTTVYYFRDGVSEGQFVHVMQQEVPHIKAVLSKIQGSDWKGKITVIIAAKRHHVRAFPEDKSGSDKNGNPLPGTLIEHDCTMPFEWDFYLYSHIALQGTARPVHYTIIHDESKHSPNVIQNMIYEHCYQYMRSTTSVSLFPAVYYAHLASNRAKAHENIPSSEGPQGGPGFKQNQPSAQSDVSESEVRPLMPMFPVNGIQFAMWYI